MTSSNRVRLTGVEEAVYGTTPANPRMRKISVTSINLSNKPVSVESSAIRDDRMASDPSVVGQTNDGSIGVEWKFPPDGSLLSSIIKSAFCSDWVNSPARDNDGVADSVIQGVDAATQVVTVAAGPAFVAGHLVYFTGFGVAVNRGKLAKVTTGSATAPAFVGAGLVDEAAPATASRMKVVGFEGAASDIKAVGDGLTSEVGGLDFTTLGIQIGHWIKVGDTASTCRFSAAGTNVWGRVIDVAARKLTLDNLPGSWAADTGAGKTIRVFFGDLIRNGVGKTGVTLERGYMGQAVPTYIAQSGMRVNTLEFGGQAKQLATGSISFNGLLGSLSTASLDSAPDEAPNDAQYPVLAFSANCGRVGEAGVAIGKSSAAKSIKFTINNNLRPLDAVSDGDGFAPGPIDVDDGEFSVSVDLDTFFGNGALLSKVMAGEQTALNTRLEKAGRAIIWDAPRVTPREGDPNVSGKNQDVMLPVKLTGSLDPLTGCQLILNRVEFFR